MKRYLTAFILLLLGLWFLRLWYGGQLSFYILPRFNPLVILSGITLVAMGGLLLIQRRWNYHHTLIHVPWRTLLSFGLVLVLGWGVSPQPLSSYSVARRGIESDLSQIKLTTPIDFTIDSTQRTFADWIKILGSSEIPKKYAGEAVHVKGFVYHPEEPLEENRFYLSRFLIRCCSADARPVVLLAESEEASRLASDTWIEVQGTWKPNEGGTAQSLFIELTDFKVIPTPEVPYIY